jgi:hypothetical protein
MFRSPSVTIAGILDARGGGGATTNGGTIKIFYRGAAPGGTRLAGGERLATY